MLLYMLFESLVQCLQLPYPSLKPTLTLTPHLGQNVGLGVGWVGSFPETYDDPLRHIKRGYYFCHQLPMKTSTLTKKYRKKM